jgi:hypothetical protein
VGQPHRVNDHHLGQRPAHGGEAIREYLATPDLAVRLPAYSLNYNADEQIWGWVREDVMANTCLGTKVAV